MLSMPELNVLKNEMGHMKSTLDKIEENISEMRKDDLHYREEFAKMFNGFRIEVSDKCATKVEVAKKADKNTVEKHQKVLDRYAYSLIMGLFTIIGTLVYLVYSNNVQ